MAHPEIAKSSFNSVAAMSLFTASWPEYFGVLRPGGHRKHEHDNYQVTHQLASEPTQSSTSALYAKLASGSSVSVVIRQFTLKTPSMSVMAIYQQLPTKADVSDVQEKRRTANRLDQP